MHTKIGNGYEWIEYQTNVASKMGWTNPTTHAIWGLRMAPRVGLSENRYTKVWWSIIIIITYLSYYIKYLYHKNNFGRGLQPIFKHIHVEPHTRAELLHQVRTGRHCIGAPHLTPRCEVFKMTARAMLSRCLMVKKWERLETQKIFWGVYQQEI